MLRSSPLVSKLLKASSKWDVRFTCMGAAAFAATVSTIQVVADGRVNNVAPNVEHTNTTNDQSNWADMTKGINDGLTSIFSLNLKQLTQDATETFVKSMMSPNPKNPKVRTRRAGIPVVFVDTSFNNEGPPIYVEADKIINDGEKEAERLWDSIITEIYDYLDEHNCHDLTQWFPLITFMATDANENNSCCIMNSVRMVKHYIKTYNLNKAHKDTSFDWEKVPPLCVLMEKNHDYNRAIGEDIDDRKAVQQSLSGAGICVSLLGHTGTGKSSLANAMLGCDADCGPFPTSNSTRSCTHDIDVCSGFERGIFVCISLHLSKIGYLCVVYCIVFVFNLHKN